MERNGEILYLSFATLMIILAGFSTLMVYRKAKTWNFEKKNNQIFVTFNRGSKQISIQDNDIEKKATLTEARFAVEIGNVGGISFTRLKVNFDTNRALIIESTAIDSTSVTDKLYKYFLEFTDDP